MKRFRFSITADATMTATVVVEAETLEQAHEIALHSDFYDDPDKAKFELDDGNLIGNVYLPSPGDYEEISNLLGFQICDRTGQNIQGEDNDPLKAASFEIFAPHLAGTLAERIGPNFILQPIFDGDIQEPSIITRLDGE